MSKRPHNKKYQEWRKAIFEIDNYECQHCGSKDSLHAHHVVEWDDSVELRYELSNGLTLCTKCHTKVHMTGHTYNHGKTPWNKGLKGVSGGTPKGTKFSEERKQKMREVRIKDPKFAEHCKKIAKARIGKPFSEEHRKKLSERTTAYWARKHAEQQQNIGS